MVRFISSTTVDMRGSLDNKLWNIVQPSSTKYGFRDYLARNEKGNMLKCYYSDVREQ